MNYKKIKMNKLIKLKTSLIKLIKKHWLTHQIGQIGVTNEFKKVNFNKSYNSQNILTKESIYKIICYY